MSTTFTPACPFPITRMGLVALEAGKHVARTKPMSISNADCNGIAMALVGDRDPVSNAKQSANRTARGRRAHESARKDNAIVNRPSFTS